MKSSQDFQLLLSDDEIDRGEKTLTQGSHGLPITLYDYQERALDLKNLNGRRVSILAWQPGMSGPGLTQVLRGTVVSFRNKTVMLSIGEKNVQIEREDILKIYLEISDRHLETASNNLVPRIQLFDPEDTLVCDNIFNNASKNGIEIDLEKENNPMLRNLIGEFVVVEAFQKDLSGPGFTQVIQGIVISFGPELVRIRIGDRTIQLIREDILYFKVMLH